MQGKASSEPDAQTRIYVGIDVCKEWLDVYAHPIGLEFRVHNTREGLKQLKRRLTAYAVGLFALEHTGKLHREAARNLHDSGYVVAVVDPARSRLFAEAMGQLAKTDKVDARSLAHYAVVIEPKAKPPASEAQETFQEHVRTRAALVAHRTAVLNQLDAANVAFVKQQLRRQIRTLESSIKSLVQAIGRIVAADPGLTRRCEILCSIKGIGIVTAYGILANFPEIGTCNAKQAGMLAGLAPIANDSGDRKGRRRIWGGRAELRSGIYWTAVSATSSNPGLRALYNRLRDSGKEKMVALTAIMRKLIVLANTLIREDRFWKPEHTPARTQAHA
jgi:transposase